MWLNVFTPVRSVTRSVLSFTVYILQHQLAHDSELTVCMQSVAVTFRIVELRSVRYHCIKFVKRYRDRQFNSLHAYESVDCVADYLSVIST
jgi:hypothetical protein